MLPVLRSRFASDIDKVFEDMWSAAPQITRSVSSSYSSFKDTGEAFELALSVPNGIDVENIKASLSGGVLTMTFPKVKTAIDIEVDEEKS